MPGLFDDIPAASQSQGATSASTAGLFDDIPAASNQKPGFNDPGYAEFMAQKHGASPDYVRSLVSGGGEQGAEGVRGIPILGAATNKVGAAVAAIMHPATGAGVPGATYGERYTKNKALEDELQADAKAAAPGAMAATNVAGGLASTGLAAGTALGARALGLAGRTLPEMIYQGAASGAGISAADEAARGGNLSDVMSAGLTGGALGGAIPPLARGVSAAAAPITSRVRDIAVGAYDPERLAAERTNAARQMDVRTGTAGLTPGQFAGAQQAGQPVMVMDQGGDATRVLARDAANTSPEAMGTLNQALNQRWDDQANRMNGWLDQNFNFPNPEAQQRAIDQVEAQVNGRAYRIAMQTGRVNLWNDPEIQRLARSPDVEQAILSGGRFEGNASILSGNRQPRLNPFELDQNGNLQLRTSPSGASTSVADIAFWDGVKKRMGDSEAAAIRQGYNAQAMQTGNLRRQLVARLDAIVPQYQQARGQAATFFGAESALEAGQAFAMPSFAARGQTNQQARAAIAQMSPLEQQLFQDGYVGRLKQQISEAPDRSNAFRNIAASPASQERLSLAVGPQRAADVMTYLHAENVMTAARRAVQGNSTTARQLMQMGIAGGAGGVLASGDLDPRNWTPEAIITGMVMAGAAHRHQRININVANQVARLLTSANPAQVTAGMRIVARNPILAGAVRNSSMALTQLGAQAVGRAATVH